MPRLRYWLATKCSLCHRGSESPTSLAASSCESSAQVVWSPVIVVILRYAWVIRYCDEGECDKAPAQDDRPEQIRLHQDFRPSRSTEGLSAGTRPAPCQTAPMAQVTDERLWWDSVGIYLHGLGCPCPTSKVSTGPRTPFPARRAKGFR